ncbi:hypothetical protein [Microbacterium sp. TPU 3598]|uniref:hypothetical protein n=1 Tax=Microbacterium sp. TPU 3598 TaxID=1938334 RepID=UPI000BBB12DD|nr:hypothetical protein [Microbacterium sp. TPU 3598]
MKGLRRTEAGPDATAHLGRFTVAHRSVQVLEKGATGVGRVGGTVQGAYTSFTNDEGLDESGNSAIRKAPDVAKRAGKTVATSAKGKSTVAATKKLGRGAGEAVKGQARTRNFAATTRNAARAAEAPVQVGTTAGRGAMAASRAAATAANVVRTAVAAVTSALTSSPIALISAVVVGVVVLIISIVGWLLPGVQQERAHLNSNYGVGVEPGPWGGHSNGFIPKKN